MQTQKLEAKYLLIGRGHGEEKHCRRFLLMDSWEVASRMNSTPFPVTTISISSKVKQGTIWHLENQILEKSIWAFECFASTGMILLDSSER